MSAARKWFHNSPAPPISRGANPICTHTRCANQPETQCLVGCGRPCPQHGAPCREHIGEPGAFHCYAVCNGDWCGWPGASSA